MLDGGKITYKINNLTTEIAPNEFQGYEVTKLIPRKVIIHNKVYGKTKFSYYAFSSAQRKQIFVGLDEIHSNNLNVSSHKK